MNEEMEDDNEGKQKRKVGNGRAGVRKGCGG